MRISTASQARNAAVAGEDDTLKLRGIPDRHRIADETILLPEIMAEGVIAEVITYLRQRQFDVAPLQSREWVELLVERAETVYAHNKQWRAKIKKADRTGANRDFLLSFMRHWTAAKLKREQPLLYEALPTSFTNGETLP